MKLWIILDSIHGFSQSYERCCYSFEKLLCGSIIYQTLRISILVRLTLIRWGRTKHTHTHTHAHKHTQWKREREWVGYFFKKNKRTKVLNCSSLFRWWQITFWELFLVSFCFNFCFVVVVFSFLFALGLNHGF